METPITALTSLGSKKGFTATYTLVSTEGKVHAPTFTYLVQIGDISATAQGPSKKKAKHAAALSALAKLAQNNEDIEELEKFKNLSKALISEHLSEKAENLSPNDNNPVGKLQELCMRKKWTPPFYDSNNTKGAQHDQNFYMSCIVTHLNVQTVGQGKSKKAAKRIAAQEMLKLLAQNNYYNENKTNISNNRDFSNSFSTTKEKVDSIIQNMNEAFLEFFDKEGEIIESSCDINYIETLEKIAAKIQFKIKSFEIYSKIKNEHLTMMSLCARDAYKQELTTLTGWGVGQNLDESKQSASKMVLTLLTKIMSKNR